MIVAVTGGTGFIGRRLVRRHLDRKDTVRLLSRRDDPWPEGGAVECFSGDLLTNNDETLHRFLNRVDVFYHCAGNWKNESLMRPLHVEGTRRLLQQAQGRIKHWVQLSSVGVYGARSVGNVTEESLEQPVGAYEITKAESDHLVQESAARAGFSYTLLRPSVVYAPDMPNESLRSWIRMIDKGLFCFVGRSGPMVNVVHADDVVSALVLCGTDVRAHNQCYNVSAAYTLEEVVATICRALGRPMIRARVPRFPLAVLASTIGWLPGMPLTGSRIRALTNCTTYSAQRIQRELNFRMGVTLDAGLREMVESVRSRGRGLLEHHGD